MLKPFSINVLAPSLSTNESDSLSNLEWKCAVGTKVICQNLDKVFVLLKSLLYKGIRWKLHCHMDDVLTRRVQSHYLHDFTSLKALNSLHLDFEFKVKVNIPIDFTKNRAKPEKSDDEEEIFPLENVEEGSESSQFYLVDKIETIDQLDAIKEKKMKKNRKM